MVKPPLVERENYQCFAQMDRWTETVKTIHLLPAGGGLHWCIDFQCWCHPQKLDPDPEHNLPLTMDYIVHRHFQPKGENGNGIR